MRRRCTLCERLLPLSFFSADFERAKRLKRCRQCQARARSDRPVPGTEAEKAERAEKNYPVYLAKSRELPCIFCGRVTDEPVGWYSYRRYIQAPLLLWADAGHSAWFLGRVAGRNHVLHEECVVPFRLMNPRQKIAPPSPWAAVEALRWKAIRAKNASKKERARLWRQALLAARRARALEPKQQEEEYELTPLGRSVK
jgi:hypothetical protein